MRTSIGIALLALAAVACSASDDSRAGFKPPANPDDGTGTTDPNDPNGKTDPSDPDTPPGPLVSGLSVADVAVLQGVKVNIVEDGKPVATSKRNAPVVAGRPGLLRVYVTPSAEWSSKSVTAELRITAGGKKLPVLRDTKTISSASKDEDTKSTFNFELTAEHFAADAKLNVALTAPDGANVTGESPARYPQDGSQADIGAGVSGMVRIVVVPVKYDTDGSGRLPDVSATQIERYRTTLMTLYPATEVQVTVRSSPLSWTSSLTGGGSGISSLLNRVQQLRQQDKPPSDVYYYGLFAPASSMQSFCNGGCVTGLSTVVTNPNFSSMRASVGVGFSGQDSANTMAHEVGHAHGREHAPCGGASSVDPYFPYAGGAIGAWGYDIFKKALVSPTRGRDMMGYCPNEWVSDYTYAGLFTRIAAIGLKSTSTGGSGGQSGQSQAHTTYRVATAGADGSLSWDDNVPLVLDEEPSGGEAREVTVTGASGALVKRSVQFFKFDHLPGGFVLIPDEAIDTAVSGTAQVKVQVSGFSTTLTR